MEALQAPLLTGSDQSPYQPIDSEGGEIRLVELVPGRYGDPISLSLRTVKIEEWVTNDDESDKDGSDKDESDEGESDDDESYDDESYDDESYDDESNWKESGGWYMYTPSVNLKSEYEALSYALGTAISPRKALIDGFELPITESLDQGLRRLRFDNKPPYGHDL
ncbi:hypothetical protein J4E91_010379 [Alternaria rosae]|nr:hypothetical protein J4E91_010379 [Alternaria rosae]